MRTKINLAESSDEREALDTILNDIANSQKSMQEAFKHLEQLVKENQQE